MIQLFKDSNIDFMGKRHFFGILSLLMVVIAGILFFSKGLKYGVDFRGGAEIQVSFASDVQADQVRGALGVGGLEGVEVQKIGEDPAKNEYLVKVASSEKDLNHTSQRVSDVFSEKFGGNFELLQVDIVGPKAGEQLRLSGFLALFWAILFIFIYVTMRFDARFAPGAVIALAHDAIFLIFIWVLTGKDFTLQTVAATLAIIGYSVNDTVVIYDRIREDLQLHPDMKLSDVINQALNATLGRTVMTTFTTLGVVASLYVLGGGVIKEFAFALLVGNLAGVYSTVFVASNITLLMDRFWEWRKKNSKQQTPSGGSFAGVS